MHSCKCCFAYAQTAFSWALSSQARATQCTHTGRCFFMDHSRSSMRRVWNRQTLVLRWVEGAEEMILRRRLSPSTSLLGIQTLAHHLPLLFLLSLIRGKGQRGRTGGPIFGATRTPPHADAHPDTRAPTHTHTHRVVRRRAQFGLTAVRYWTSELGS